MGWGDRLFKGMRTFGQKLCQESCSEKGEEQTKERGVHISEKVASETYDYSQITREDVEEKNSRYEQNSTNVINNKRYKI